MRLCVASQRSRRPGGGAGRTEAAHQAARQAEACAEDQAAQPHRGDRPRRGGGGHGHRLGRRDGVPGREIGERQDDGAVRDGGGRRGVHAHQRRERRSEPVQEPLARRARVPPRVQEPDDRQARAGADARAVVVAQGEHVVRPAQVEAEALLGVRLPRPRRSAELLLQRQGRGGVPHRRARCGVQPHLRNAEAHHGRPRERRRRGGQHG